MRFFIQLTIIVIFTPIFTYGQNRYPEGGSPQSPQAMANARVRENNSQSGAFNRNNQKLTPSGLPLSQPLPPKTSKKARKLLRTNEEDEKNFSAFLKQPHTGLIRLFALSDCTENDEVFSAKNEFCQLRSEIPGLGSAYSFRQDEHLSKKLSDLQFTKGLFFSVGYLTQGILVSLGDVDLSEVSLNMQAARYLVSFQPARTIAEANEQLKQLANGVHSENYFYRAFLPASENTTYILRSVAYRDDNSPGIRLTKDEIWRLDEMSGDKRVDVVIAFRVVRKDTDGSLTVLWKELQRKDSPKLKTKSGKSEKND